MRLFINTRTLLRRLQIIGLGSMLAFPAFPQGILEEVVVTARKRVESLQDTPISITAFTADSLEQKQVTNVAEIDQFTPNMIFNTGAQISGTNSAGSIFIRGIGQVDFLLTQDPGVGLYLDGVYIARSIGSVIDLVDVERIEVLRGPQGTLFGRNTIGGAVNITSKKPSEEFTAGINVTTGSYERIDVKADVSGQIAENLYGSLALARFDRNGHIKRPFLGDRTGEDDAWAGRAALRWTPTPDLDVNLTFDTTHEDETSCCGELVAVYDNGDTILNLAAVHNAFVAPGLVDELGSLAFFNENSIPTEEFVDNSGFDVPADLTVYGVNLDVEWDVLDNLTFKSITSFRDLESKNGRDEDHSPVLIGHTIDDYDNKQFSQELQVKGALFNERLNWIAGLYYFEEQGVNKDDVEFTIVHLISGGETDNDSTAAFAQLTFAITEQLSVTGGLRWTKDVKRFEPTTQYVLTLGPGLGLPTTIDGGRALLLPPDEVKSEFTEVTPHVNLSYQWNDDLMTYVTYSEGFKSGGFVQRIFPARTTVPTFAPEFAEVYEGGIKWTGFDNRLRVNAAGFFTEYTDLQVRVFDGIAPVLQNAAGAEIAGAELEISAVPGANWLIEAGIGYLTSRYTEIDPAATEVRIDNELVYTPEWNLNLSIGYTLPLMGWGTLTPRLDWSYQDDIHIDGRNTAALFQEGYHLLHLGLIFQDNSEKWTVALTGSNVTDERYKTTGFADEAIQSIAEANFGRPAEWALKIGYRF